MTAAHLFAHSNDALCVAEDTAVAFFAPKTLKKFRVERFGGARVCGLFVQVASSSSSATGSILHVVDVEGNWYVVSLKDLALTSSSTIRIGNKGKGGAQPAGSMILEAHFHQAEGRLHCVLLRSDGVFETVLEPSKELIASAIMKFSATTGDYVMGVSDRTGLVVVGQKEERWLQYSTMGTRTPDSSAKQRRQLPLPLHSLACSPASESVAVGGSRGELVLYPNVSDPHFFSDHWHHTALTAIHFSVDGTSLYTGARESVLLVWNLSSYTHRKIHCNLGPIRSVVPSRGTGSTLVLACGESTLATVDLLQMRLQSSMEGIEWSSEGSCSGLVVDSWMGQPVVMLTGLPNVLRVCDPHTQQSVYSLHVSSQMETIPNSPKHGIKFAAMLREGRIIVTYESFASTVLPSLLRFWAYDAAQRKHVEVQTIYKPHNSEVLSLQVDKTGNRVFTLSSDAIKCWEEVQEDANDALAGSKRSWRNQSSTPTPTPLVKNMTLSPDGSLCLVVSDSVHVYAVHTCKPGERWAELLTLSQSCSTAALSDLLIIPSHRVVMAYDANRVYAWNLAASPLRDPVVFEAPAGASITSLCSFSEDTVLVACSDRSFVALHSDAVRLCTVAGRAVDATSSSVQYMQPLPGQENRVAIVDEATGFRVLSVNLTKESTSETQYEGAALPAEADSSNSIRRFFNDVSGPTGVEQASDAQLHDAARMQRANQWLKGVLHEPAYTAPPMSSVLSLYLKQRTGVQ